MIKSQSSRVQRARQCLSGYDKGLAYFTAHPEEHTTWRVCMCMTCSLPGSPSTQGYKDMECCSLLFSRKGAPARSRDFSSSSSTLEPFNNSASPGSQKIASGPSNPISPTSVFPKMSTPAPAPALGPQRRQSNPEEVEQRDTGDHGNRSVQSSLTRSRRYGIVTIPTRKLKWEDLRKYLWLEFFPDKTEGEVNQVLEEKYTVLKEKYVVRLPGGKLSDIK
ncbi:hypothetical protein B0T17DRAFT_263376 [Bombardia bombarda]|uniref:Uncharacterized protein n=1 Tax=Bombardia bombarda TaxID=252184 RepID=A0AA39X0S9_9PEZI|nr:hypothetical protein B0T17DRAFT_263376 [Bombardia bombarda]